MAKTRNFADVIRKQLANDPDLRDAVEVERLNADIAAKLYELRTSARLTQKQLADLVGTTQSVISRIEDSDYEGHSLSLLRRIATALGKRLSIEFADPIDPSPDGEDEVTIQAEWPSTNLKRRGWDRAAFTFEASASSELNEDDAVLLGT
jgi:transcriptional regulator with XRE-family HTH domain